MADDLPKLVAISKLETDFLPGCVRHRFYEPPSTLVTREEVWDIREEIGRGGCGIVRKEELRANPLQNAEVRAVKQITKLQPSQPAWTYRDELAAIIKFSQPQYAPYFVSIFGWFESTDSIFIAMEYLPDGDLEHYKNASPPFLELDTTRIVRQLLGGVRYMHENGFAHRDLKPGNILISSTTPSWHIKIADFGISKQVFRGVTRQQTANMFGTMGYAAPEALGYYDESDNAITYTISVDIWAVGTIALTLLLGRDVFPSPGHLSRYVNQQRPLEFSRQRGDDLTDLCRDFISGLLAPDPVARPTAIAALAHPWLNQEVTPPPEGTGMNSTRQLDSANNSPLQDARRVKLEVQQEHQLATIPDIVVKTETKPEFRLYPPRDAMTIGRIHEMLYLDNVLLARNFRRLVFNQTRYFVLRSDNATDIETSAAHGVWTSSSRVNKILDKAFAQSGGHVVMFFSVILSCQLVLMDVRSRKFCGVARMTSPLDWINTDPHWLEDGWQGRFTVNWLSHTELSFDRVKHVPVKESTPGFRAVACYDGTEISRGSAWELLRAYSSEERQWRPFAIPH
ncbi:Serine/threonine-protein kinase 17B [Madurella mycetomatis]|uniref:non-specific serine/threonine protein kinase n=1 Tax=Madurella mycetomatis TaxID=100816 RepID=A0A175WDF0_9PEZI|nr:Serine/threonine-protein kinase 17B [Madurella mycetomatis]